MTDQKPNGKPFRWLPDPDETVALDVYVGGDVMTLQAKRCLTVAERDRIEELWSSSASANEKMLRSIVAVVRGWPLKRPGTETAYTVSVDALREMHAHGFDAIWAVVEPHMRELMNVSGRIAATEDTAPTDPPTASVSASG